MKTQNPKIYRGNVVVVVLMIVAGIAIIAGSYFMARSNGSKERVDDSLFAEKIDGDLAQKFRKESENFEKQFNSLQEFKKDQLTMDDIEIFKNALDAYEKYLSYSGIPRNTNARADKMRKRLHNLCATKIRSRTLELEAEAEQLAQQNKHAAAEKKFREAYGLEKRIDTQYALAEIRNSARTQMLYHRMQSMQSIPMTARAERLEQEGDAAMEEKNWPRAGLKFREAAKIFQRLNNEFSLVSFDNGNALIRVNRKIDTVSSSPYQNRIDEFCEQANELELQGDFEAAATARGNALAEYNLLATNYPHSNFASDETRKKLETAAANTSAAPEFIKLQGIMDNLLTAIVNGDFAQLPNLARNAAIIAHAINEDFPQATILTKDLLQTLAYIDVSSAVTEQIRVTLNKSLIAIPGVPANERKMLDREVAQALFQAVTQKNPSATENPLAPVDSVTFFDAEEFCNLLSLLVGYEVRLPSKDEYLAARGNELPADDDAILAQAWLMENSNSRNHDVATSQANGNGFFDLLGNVSEWIGDDLLEAAGVINPDSGEINAFSVGGDYLTPLEFLRATPISKSPKNDRSRQRGFRFVVDFTKPIDLNHAKITIPRESDKN